MSRLRRLISSVRDEQGQTAFAFALLLVVISMFFALSVDAGLWYFDHRTAQQQAEAASLAAVQALPSNSTTAASDAANDWLTRNGATPCAPGCLTYGDRNGDGLYDMVTTSVRRDSPSMFSSLSSVTSVTVSASATALVGPATIANVMPWAVVPPDPNCDAPGETCRYDANGDGDFVDTGECQADFSVCPWGLNPDNLYRFKSGTGGNTGVIDACGNGSSNYTDCIEGELISGFFAEGTTVNVGLQGGNLGQNTDNALRARYAAESPGWTCDVSVSPSSSNGYDPDGRAAAYARFGPAGPALCAERLVLIPILRSMPPQGGGSASLEVLGVATFGLAGWNRESNKSYSADASHNCREVKNPPADSFDCGMVWGYFMEGLRPPGFLLQQIGTTDNPFAPLLIALVD